MVQQKALRLDCFMIYRSAALEERRSQMLHGDYWSYNRYVASRKSASNIWALCSYTEGVCFVGVWQN
ncbi:unnamed protein product [Rhodiola kirilowii]